ncbi:MAG TPA: hypothetical protein VMH35_16635 [Streptosporangiaceae bacterium]|nr:hypothetical protein [Streptosporangiaceae bacterium]
MDHLALESPDLGPLRALAETAEFTEAVARLADAYGRPLPADDSLVSLARDIAWALTEAGFTLCTTAARAIRWYRLGGVCVLPVARGHDPDGRGGVVVSWTTHDLLSLDWSRWRQYQGAQGVMNGALSEVLDLLGFEASPFGAGGAWIMTGRRAGWEAAER